MSVFDTIQIAASGLTAQRLRMDVAASNIANASTTNSPAGVPYQQEAVVLTPRQMGPEPAAQGVAGVAILNPNRSVVRVYDPTNPDADASGFVNNPNVDVASEMADMMGAVRSYQMSSTCVAAAKQEALEALELGKA